MFDLYCPVGVSPIVKGQRQAEKRISVLVGPDGNVVKVFPTPDVETRALEVLDDLGD